MSTKQTIVFDPPIHIYNECLSNQICIEFERLDMRCDKVKMVEQNEKYGSLVLSRDQLIKIRDKLSEYLETK